VFVNAVAAQRGATVAQVLQHMADGRVFIGQQAIDAGLVDGVSTVDAMVEQLATNPAAFAPRRKARFASAAAGTSVPTARAGVAPALGISLPPGAGDAHEGDPPTDPKGISMSQGTEAPQVSRESLERDHPNLFAQMRDVFRAEGAAGELTRVKAVLAEGEGIKGHEALVMRLALDGQSTGPVAAQAILAAERSQLQTAAAAHAKDAPAAAAAAPAPADAAEGATRETQAAQAKAYAAEHGVSFVAALKKLGFTL
jgi:ClpP class serine protease